MPIKYFTPGNNSTSSRIINYIAAYDARFPNDKSRCSNSCIPPVYNKTVLSSDSSSNRQSRNISTSYIINNTRGGSTRFGNFYLGKSFKVNFLGRTEGMPGGSGSPPVNKFN